MEKTALELSTDEWRSYRPLEGLKRRLKDSVAEISARKGEGWKVARKAGQILRKEFCAKKVVVFGSLARDEWFSLWSDIDIAAWGIAPEVFYSAVAAVTGLSSTFRIDLVDMAECRPILRKVIEEEGVEI
jgi:predicted nucleotidyltransferase